MELLRNGNKFRLILLRLLLKSLFPCLVCIDKFIFLFCYYITLIISHNYLSNHPIFSSWQTKYLAILLIFKVKFVNGTNMQLWNLGVDFIMIEFRAITKINYNYMSKKLIPVLTLATVSKSISILGSIAYFLKKYLSDDNNMI